MTGTMQAGTQPVQPIAVIGMAGRFPRAEDVEQFWTNLRNGVHGIHFFTDEELLAAGVPAEVLRDPEYVKATGVLEGADLFDAAFFGYNPREAEVIDPQQRVFLETAWAALENAGYAPGGAGPAVGVYAGSSESEYMTYHVLAHPEVAAAMGGFQVFVANCRDFLATRAAHKLDLRGPAFTVQTACSTGLVSIHLACQAVAAGECDIAVAGGVSINPLQDRGYRYTPRGTSSPDGYCRAFDARAGGTLDGGGVALVVLKRLDEALADGDTIHAVVLGSAINNDGAQKVGFTAPSVEGQAAAIEEALAVAGVDPETIGYVEAHGTGTALGDPVEVAALTKAFGRTRRKQYCALGSVKTNIGHLDSAAGAAGFIKAALAVQRGEIPPTLHFTAPNPRIDFAGSPFFVSAELRAWPAPPHVPRRAGVSSFGIGGTNAHAVLEQPPEPEPSLSRRDWHLLTLSARTAAALEAATDRLAAHLRAHPEQALADVAYTLQVGRRGWEHRRAVVARHGAEAAAALEARGGDRSWGGVGPEGGRPVDFLFHGVGSQYAGMGRGLYEREPVFREIVDRCAATLLPRLGADLREILYPTAAADEQIDDPQLAQLVVFVTDYALARLWMHWGVRPRAMIGHSLGEYVAATVAGVWSLEDALMLVAERGALLLRMPEGAMLALGLDEAEVRPLLRDGLCLATLNGPGSTVVSGPVAAVEALQAEVAARGVFHRRIPIPRAAHSTMMEGMAGPLEERVRGVRLRPPSIPFVSNVTGEWIRDGEATDPAYWARHLCTPVRFADGIATLARDGRSALLEVGPGHALRSMVSRLPIWEGAPPPVITSLRHRYEELSDDAYLLEAAGQLWAVGVSVDWKALHEGERLRRVPLPTYPFERRRYWIDRPAPGATGAPVPGPGSAAGSTSGLYVPAWTRAPLPAPAAAMPAAEWLVLADGDGVGARLAAQLAAAGHTVAVAAVGEAFGRDGAGRYTARPGSGDDLRALRQALEAEGMRPGHVVHLWGIGPADGDADEAELARALACGYETVAALGEMFAPGEEGPPLRLVVVTEGVQDVAGGEPVRPERATVTGACLTLPYEHPRVACRTVDVRRRSGGDDALARRLAAEVTSGAVEDAALRGPLRWARGEQPVRPGGHAAGVPEGGAYLFSGAPDAAAAGVAAFLAGERGARVAVLVEPDFPPPEAWNALASGAAAASAGLARAVEEAGGEVLLVRASADDAAGVADAMEQARRTFGRLDGVVHGVRAIQAEGADLPAAVRELAALEAAAAAVRPGRVVLWSSLASVAPAAGDGPAAAAGALAEAWVRRHTAGGGEGWTSVAWDPGAAAAEGGAAFTALVALADEPRVVVCTDPPALRRGRGGAAPSASTEGMQMHPRPELPGGYQPPTSAAEEILAGIWSELLGLEEVGIHDSFFVLGGHSLLGLQLIVRVREAFQVELPLRTLFQAPTIAALAVRIDEAILQELEEMSDEEVLGLMGAAE